MAHSTQAVRAATTFCPPPAHDEAGTSAVAVSSACLQAGPSHGLDAGTTASHGGAVPPSPLRVTLQVGIICAGVSTAGYLQLVREIDRSIAS